MNDPLREALEEGHPGAYRCLFENDINGVAIFDRRGRLIDCNQRAIELLGYEHEEAVGKTPADFSPDRQPDGTSSEERARELIDAVSDGESMRFEWLCRRKDGTTFCAETALSPFEYDGRTYVQAVVADITERKNAVRELREAKERAEEASRLKSAFLANVSHEIRTPLASIIGFADVIEDQLADSGREFVDLIRTSGQRLLETLNSVLDLARLEGGSVDLDPRSFDAVAATDEVVSSYEEEAEAKGLDLRFDTSLDTAEIFADRGVFRRILDNLIGNAVTFTREGSIDVFLQTEDGEVAVHVRDTGVGIEEDELEVIFQPFHQESRGFTREYEGIGLGLTVTRKLVHLLEGEIDVDSEKGSGTTFAVRLPQHIDREDAEHPSLESAHQWGLSMLPPDQKTLIVEDDPNMQMLVSEYLPDSYSIDTVSDARSAIERAETERYDLVLMDINLRDSLNGVDILHRFREDSECENALIVAITAYALPGDGESFKAEGFDGYVSKPFTRETLYERLIQVL